MSNTELIKTISIQLKSLQDGVQKLSEAATLLSAKMESAAEEYEIKSAERSGE